MRKLMTLALASTALAAIACGKDKTPTSAAMSADLKRDLQLASATENIRINPDEVSQAGKPEPSVKPKRAPQGPRVVRTEQPTVQASAAPVEDAEVKAEVPQVQVMAPAQGPSDNAAPDAPPMARPSPVSMPSYPGTGTGVNTGGSNGGGGGTAGGVLGGIFGAVIRGGHVGDDDHCDPRQNPRRGRPVGGDIIYGGGRTIPTGMGGARVPVRPMVRPR